MEIRRFELSDAPVEIIDRLAGNFFFSSTSFAKLWITLGGNPVYWTYEVSSIIKAILPGVEFGKGIFRRFQSMPDGCYSRVLLNEPVEVDSNPVTQQIIERIIKENYTKIFLNDFYGSIVANPKLNTDNNKTLLVNISIPDWQPPDPKLRQQIHKAERENLTICKFDSVKHLDKFMRLVSLHEKRRGIGRKYSKEFYMALAETAAHDNRINWVWCEHNSSPASSHIFLREGDGLLHWEMYYDESLSHLQATKLVPYQVAQDAAAKGIKYLNLGLSPEGAEGAEFYKSKWGGSEHDYKTYHHKNFLGKLW